MGETCCDFNAFVKALADETRQCILTHLQAGELKVGDIVTCTDLTQPTVSHHLALLRHANLVLTRRDGQRIYYRVNSSCVAAGCREIQARFSIRREQT